MVCLDDLFLFLFLFFVLFYFLECWSSQIRLNPGWNKPNPKLKIGAQLVITVTPTISIEMPVAPSWETKSSTTNVFKRLGKRVWLVSAYLGSFASDAVEDGIVFNCTLKFGGKEGIHLWVDKAWKLRKRTYSSPKERFILSHSAIYPSVEQAIKAGQKASSFFPTQAKANSQENAMVLIYFQIPESLFRSFSLASFSLFTLIL